MVFFTSACTTTTTCSNIIKCLSSTLTVMLIFMISSLVSTIGLQEPSSTTDSLVRKLQTSEFAAYFSTDSDAIRSASMDFGGLAKSMPAAVFHASSDHDTAALVSLSYMSKNSFVIAPRGQGHSVRGQALAADGVVIDMSSLRQLEARINVVLSDDYANSYVDAGGEQLWIDVLHETLKYGLAPKSWTDYLYLTVGGTLSNAGISGQAFLHGPQISNVYEMDIITGKGEMLTCSEHHEADLFFAVLGGLGQFGIITRARIALEAAPELVMWVRLIYSDFDAFTKDQEKLISLDHNDGFNYVEGSILMEHSLTNNWRSSFYAEEDIDKIRMLAAQSGAVYCLEVAKYYNQGQKILVKKEIMLLIRDLSFVPGFEFKNDVTYLHFLNRVHDGELKLKSRGLWDVPHPWLNIFVPQTAVLEFGQGVVNLMLQYSNNSLGPVLIYAMNKNKWDKRTSAVIPEEQIFYCIGLLLSSPTEEWHKLEDQNNEILHFANQADIKYKLYLPHYKTTQKWSQHFGQKWDTFLERKTKYDPRRILSPGQGIFSSLVSHASAL